MYEIRDHTADLAIHVEASDLESLMVQAAEALFSVIAGQLEGIDQRETIQVHIEGTDPDWLLVDWLSELLYQFDSHRLLFSRFAVRIDDEGLHGEAHGEPFDPARHQLEHEVKAITYHGLSVRQNEIGWTADFVVDI